MPDAVDKAIIHLNINELDLNKVYPTSHALIGDAKFSLQALTDMIKDQTNGSGVSNDTGRDCRPCKAKGAVRPKAIEASGSGDPLQVLSK